MNKKIALSGLIAATAASMMFTPPLEAATTQSVQFQMNQLSYSNDSGKHALTTAPYELRGHSMVPLRALATSLGSNVSWNQSNQTTTLSGPSYDDIKLTVNSNIAIDADGRQIKLPERVTLVKGSVFVPVRSMAVLMKAQLKWESGTRTVTVTKPSDAANHIQRSYNFAADKQGWKGGFSDLPVDYDPDIYELEHTRELIPLEDGKEQYGLKLSGVNRSDDLFMFLSRNVGGLTPNTTYDVKMSFAMYTDQQGGMVGIGGAPAESVFVKAGIVNKEPRAVVVEEAGTPYYRMNVDIGNQSISGEDAKVIGDITKPNPDKAGFQRVDFDYSATVTSNAQGEIYLLIGTDSGFEGLTTLYYNDIKVAATPK